MVARFAAYLDDRCYRFSITSEMLWRCPRWDPQRGDNPPLPAATALAKAREFISAFATPIGSHWEVQELALVALRFSQDWVWRARFHRLTDGFMMGPPIQMDCWILMDGTVVQPWVMEDKK